MNDADTDKLYTALAITTNLEAQLTNFISRGGRAGKAWAAWGKESQRDPAQKAAMKEALTALTSMAKDVKLVLKELDKATREAGNKATLAKYATGKEYRDKVLLAKQLPLATKWDKNGAKFLTAIGKCVAPFPFPKPSGGVDETAAAGAIKNYGHYWDEMQKALAKLG